MAEPHSETSARPRVMENDVAADALGIVVEATAPGHAVLTMVVRDDMLNGFGITHGGFVFALADTAFAYACNQGETVTVASGADITFFRSTGAGQTLRATATQRATVGRNGLCDITVTDDSGELVAEYRGRSFTTNRAFAND
ncbi:MAG TPA: hydroxyphenylacetyl-CoA thioesterase PaaI [Candidatus Lumbricidophila sp.]|nr:hydroxyphenylacetyl-CoA thioesterase PaaI [Candidatus Lumbricidophila sp.]